MHLIAVTQIRHFGRAYYLRKIAEDKNRKEALRALKRRISDAVWRQLRVDLTAANQTGSGRTPGTTREVQRGRLCILKTGSSDSSLPNPTQRYAQPTALSRGPNPARPNTHIPLTQRGFGLCA
jgi:transposase